MSLALLFNPAAFEQSGITNAGLPLLLPFYMGGAPAATIPYGDTTPNAPSSPAATILNLFAQAFAMAASLMSGAFGLSMQVAAKVQATGSAPITAATQLLALAGKALGQVKARSTMSAALGMTARATTTNKNRMTGKYALVLGSHASAMAKGAALGTYKGSIALAGHASAAVKAAALMTVGGGAAAIRRTTQFVANTARLINR